ncbi:MAG TPA: cache domain-containing protein, partial [Limnochordia bacterium]
MKTRTAQGRRASGEIKLKADRQKSRRIHLPALSLKTRAAATMCLVLSAVLVLGLLFARLLVRQEEELVLREYLSQTRYAAATVDAFLRRARRELTDISRLPELGDPETDLMAKMRVLRYATVGLSEVFTYSIALLDQNGTVIWAEPDQGRVGTNLRDRPHVAAAWETKAPVVTDHILTLPAMPPAIAVAAPILDQHGAVVGALDGTIALDAATIRDVVGISPLPEPGRQVELVDQEGRIIVLSRDQPPAQLSPYSPLISRLLAEGRGGIFRNPTTAAGVKIGEIVAFVPLTEASWGLLIRQPEAILLGPVRRFSQFAIAVMFL